MSITEPDFDKMSVKELINELKKKNAKGFSHKNKAELIKQLKEICAQVSTHPRQLAEYSGSSRNYKKFKNFYSTESLKM